jgi:hypothetical protein
LRLSLVFHPVIGASTYMPTQRTGIDRGRYVPLIIAVESSNNAQAHSYLGEHYGRGLMGISVMALKEYNDWNGTHIKPADTLRQAHQHHDRRVVLAMA